MENLLTEKKIVIVGGGFGGIRTALDLSRHALPGVKIILISDRPHFEYHAALYRVVTGKSPLEVCVPLRDIFLDTAVDICHDTVTAVDLKTKTVSGLSGTHYSYDYLVLALGSETSYFDIMGLKEFSFGFKSITEALRLKRHLHTLFDTRKNALHKSSEPIHIVIVGGGASGVELTGELAVYTQLLSRKHGIDSATIKIDLIEAAPRILPTLPQSCSRAADERLKSLGVTVMTSQTVMREDISELYLKDREVKTKTVIWTAGVQPHGLHRKIVGLALNDRGKAIVDEHLQGPGHENVFVIGDAAATKYAGMAQTALHDGRYVASVIQSKVENRPVADYIPVAPAYAIPIGPGWALARLGSMQFVGSFGWWLRRCADFRFFLSILPVYKAILAFRSGTTLCESCTVCDRAVRSV